MTSMDAAWIPVIVAVLTIVRASATYAYQRRIDRRNALVELRRSAYRNYLSAFMAMSDSPETIEDIRRSYYQAEVELLVVGSDQVIEKVGALSRFYGDTNDDRFNRSAGEVRRLVAEVCKSMRADCFERSNLAISEIQALVPIA